jgi:hypothetical protein
VAICAVEAIMRTSIAVAVLLMLCADAAGQPQTDWAAPATPQTLTECGRSDGYAYYFTGGLITAGKGGWQKDGITDGRIILNYNGSDVDLLITVFYEVGTLTEDYVFQVDDRGNGTVAWTSVRTAGTINKMWLMTAQCRSPR